jgi:hypothetical protein
MKYKTSDLRDFASINYLDDVAPNKDLFWMQVEAVLGLLYKIHPIEMIETEKAAEALRGSNGGKIGGIMPARLGKWLTVTYREPDSLPLKGGKDQFYRDFYKKYPQFSFKQ